jgi:hypothetical protein
MFEEIYDNVLSALDSAGFINWHFKNIVLKDKTIHPWVNFKQPLCSTCRCIDCKSLKKLPSRLKYKSFYHGHNVVLPYYETIDLNDVE